MNRLDRIKLAIKKGYTCNPDTGKVFGIRGGVLKTKSTAGYAKIDIWDKKNYQLLSHQFVWYWVNKEVVECIDHINGNKLDNRISNLRSVTEHENHFNVNKYIHGDVRGWSIKRGKYCSTIRFNKKYIHLGTFDTPDEAHKAYLDAKKIYHNING